MKKRALITGATGLLGSWLACELLKKNCYEKIYLLARSRANFSAKRRINSVFRIVPHNLSKKDFKKITVIDGDILDPHLGMDRVACIELMRELTDVFHCAALAEFGMNLKQIRPTNVNGTRDLLKYTEVASGGRGGAPIHFHHISTVAVAGNRTGFFGESDFGRKASFNNAYEQSKFEAENEVSKYRKANMNITLYRPAVITGDSRYGITTNFKMIYQPLHFLYHNLFSVIPANPSSCLSIVPVDKVAKAISILSESKESRFKVYNIINPSEMKIGYFINTGSDYFGFRMPKMIPLNRCGKSVLSGAQWKLIDPFLPYLNYKIRFRSTTGNKLLAKAGFKWPVVDKRLLGKLFDYCLKTKFTPASI